MKWNRIACFALGMVLAAPAFAASGSGSKHDGGRGKQRGRWGNFKKVKGVVKSTDTGKNTLTLTVTRKTDDGETEEDRTFTLSEETRIRIGRKKSTLADIEVGDKAGVVLSAKGGDEEAVRYVSIWRGGKPGVRRGSGSKGSGSKGHGDKCKNGRRCAKP